MRVRYIYSACVVIETPDLRLLCDPWFTQGIYEGAWYTYPPIRDPITTIGEVDAIYISHIHPDHYDPVFLRSYLAVYPKARLLIGPTEPQYLANRMKRDGFSFELGEQFDIGATRLTIAANKASEVNIDTGLTVARGVYSIVNLNDNPFDLEQIKRLREACPGRRPTLAMVPHAGAGEYPHTYEMSPEQRVSEERRKANNFLDCCDRFIAALDPQWVLPFAGQFVLGGPLAALNRHRGIADATEVVTRHPMRAIVLADGGDATFDLTTGIASRLRTEPYDPDAIARYTSELPFEGYVYEREIRLIDGRPLPLVPLLRAAYGQRIAKHRVPGDWWICFRPRALGRYLTCNAGYDSGVVECEQVEDLVPRWEVYIDDRQLFGVLSRLYTWNSVLLGCHCRCLRIPDEYRRDVLAFIETICL